MTHRFTLAFSASHGDGALALLRDGQVVDAQPIGPQGSHNSRILVVATELLRQHDRSLPELASLAVDIGPGSFTGIRLALSAARAFAWLGSLPVYTVNSLDVLALHAVEATGLRLFALCLDARRGAFYRAVYEVREAVNRLVGPELVMTEGLRDGLPDNCALAGRFPPGAKQTLAAGLVTEIELEYRPADFALVAAREIAQGYAVDWAGALPLYLRRPEAEEVWESRYGRPEPPAV